MRLPSYFRMCAIVCLVLVFSVLSSLPASAARVMPSALEGKLSYDPGVSSFKIDVYPGSNVIGVPVETTIKDIERYVALKESGGYKAWYYDAPSSSRVGATYLMPGRGYWIEALNAGTIEISGDMKATSLELYKGWNLISVSDQMSVADIEKEAKLKETGGYRAWLCFSPTAGRYGTGVLLPGFGYWVESDGRYSVRLTAGLSETISRVRTAVVRIVTPGGSGSGFVVDKKGWILTNNHVVSGARTVTAVMDDGTELKASVLGKDENIDLALLQVTPPAGLSVVTIGDSGKVKIGEDVTALGYPLGSSLGTDLSATRGIVSSLRNINGVDYVQTDAPLNPGNSGGPLINSSGQVIGINTMKVERTGTRNVEGIGLAVASRTFLMQIATLATQAEKAAAAAKSASGKPGGDVTTYTNSDHWYDISLPKTWTVDEKDTDRVVIKDPATTLSLWINVYRYDRIYSPDVDAFLGAKQPVPAGGATGWTSVSTSPAARSTPARSIDNQYSWQKDGVKKVSRFLYYVIGDIYFRIEATANDSEWSSVKPALDRAFSSFRPSLYTDKDLGYSFSTPLDWLLDSEDSSLVVAMEPNNLAAVQVSLLRLSSRYTDVYKLMDEVSQYLGAGMDDYKQLDKSRVRRKEKVPGQILTYSFTSKGVAYTAREFSLVARGYLFDVVFQTRSSSWGLFEPLSRRIVERVNVAP